MTEDADSAGPEPLLLDSRQVPVGDGTLVRRLLPQRRLRTVGAWCFADHYGPDDITGGRGMQVPPHPHTGLQTVSWLVEGEVLHRDSLGSAQRVGPRELSLMTAGKGIAHSEESPPDHSARLHGLQLWVAQPDADRYGEPAYEHHADLPQAEIGPLRTTLLLGAHNGLTSPGTTFSPLVGLEVVLPAGTDAELPLDPTFEHALLAMEGLAVAEDLEVGVGALLRLDRGRASVGLSGTDRDTRLVLLGGAPLDEPLVLWWNFVCRSGEEVARARADWETGDRFGEVVGYPGSRLSAPPLGPARLLPRS